MAAEHQPTGGEREPGAKTPEALETVEAAPVTERSVSRLAAAAAAAASAPGRAEGATSHPTRAMTPRGLLSMQRSAGNRAVQRLAGDMVVQREGVKPRVSVSGRSVAPTEIMSKSSEIALRKGSHEAVAWTTPNWEFDAPSVSSGGATVRLGYEIRFIIDLPSDYDADAVAMLRAHELGHVEIAKRKAKEAFEVKLKAKLEAKTDVTDDVVIADVRAALEEAKAAEKAASKAFDDAEYKVISDRYKGIRRSLADLSKSSPAIAAAARVLKRVPGSIRQPHLTSGPFALETLAGQVSAAAGALSPAEAARVQFNNEFQGLVGAAKGAADSFISSVEGLPGIGEGRDDNLEAVKKIAAACGGFSYSSAGASAAF